MSIIAATLSFAAVVGLLTIVPGLDTALVLRTAIKDGQKHAFATALGINTGTLLWGLGAAGGLAVLLTASHLAYTTLRIAGAIYLVYLGIATLWSTWRSRHDKNRHEPEGRAAASPSFLRAWTRGATTNLLNPKVGAFYIAIFPQFIPAGVPHLLVGLLFALVHSIEGILWFTLLIYGTHMARVWLSRPSVKRATQAITGTVLVGFGLKLALDSSKP